MKNFDGYTVSELPETAPPLLRDVAFNRHSMNDGTHTSPFDNKRIDVGTDEIVVSLLQGINEEAMRKTLGRSVLATIGVNPDNPPEDLPWEEMLEGGLQSALETQVIVFEVSGISRALTHQLVRTRKASFHQQSQRATYMGKHPDVRMPDSIMRNEKVRAAYEDAIAATHFAYEQATKADIAYQDARYILPEGTETYILCEYSILEFMKLYSYRACSMFLWEMVHTVREMKRVLVDAHPWIEPYIKITCEKGQVCSFQGWESVEEQCDFPWAIDDKRAYKPSKELRIGK